MWIVTTEQIAACNQRYSVRIACVLTPDAIMLKGDNQFKAVVPELTMAGGFGLEISPKPVGVPHSLVVEPSELVGVKCLVTWEFNGTMVDTYTVEFKFKRDSIEGVD